jgi:hypothetical protein
MPQTAMPSARNPLDLATVLAAGTTPDVVMLEWTGKALPGALLPRYREALQALRLVRGVARRGSADDFARLEQAALGIPGIAGPDRAIIRASPQIAAMSTSLLQATRREMALAARHQPVLFAGRSDFYNHARFSMTPVGRLLLDQAAIDGAAAAEAMDALMTALALLGALQEAAQRYRTSGVVALPWQWLSSEDVAADALGQPRCSPGLRQAYNRGIDRAHELLVIAGPARGLRGLGGWVKANNLLAHRLLGRLQRKDPLARPVVLGLFDRLALRLANI